MKKTKKFLIYKNKIILANGSSLKIISSKYINNYQVNLKNVKKIKTTLNKDNKTKIKLNFIKSLI